jgi:hydrogenase maturation protease
MIVKTLLLGMGNPILRDDAVGIRLAADISRRLGPIDGLDVVAECSVGGFELLPVVQGYSRVVMFDSIRTQDARPGAWHRFTAADLGPTMNLINVHDTNFATALELGRRVGLKVPAPEAIHVFAVEILENLTFDERMSPILEQTYPDYADAIFAEVAALLGARS